jgi:hypothetical protein
MLPLIGMSLSKGSGPGMHSHALRSDFRDVQARVAIKKIQPWLSEVKATPHDVVITHPDSNPFSDPTCQRLSNSLG